MEPTSPPPVRVEKYFFGTATEAERQEVERWIAADPRRGAALEAVRAWWDSPEGRPDGAQGDIDVERALAKVLPHLDGSAASTKVAPIEARPRSSSPAGRPTAQFSAFFAPARHRSALRWVSGLAAAAILAVAGNTLWTRYVSQQDGGARPMKQLVTARGESATADLPDGTRVLLGADSKIRYPDNFANGNRSVYLEGVAYFDVTHHSTQPFVVHAGNAVVRELGTSFSVTSYPGDTTVRVVVSQGRVSLAQQSTNSATDRSSSVILERGAMGTLTQRGNAFVTVDVDLTRELGWTKRHFSYSAVPLRDVVRDLERWYDVVIYVNDASLLSRPLSATFGDESIDEIVAQLATLSQAHVRRDGRTITIDRVAP